jgi:activator of HSP90 ATPase
MPLTRRSFAKAMTASAASLALPSALFGATESQSDLGISHTAESIHQESVIKAMAARVYAALTDSQQFDAVSKLSAAAKTMPPHGSRTEIGRVAGATFTAFGGYITGRQIELVAGMRIVQVWRSAAWKDGEYSLVRFELTPLGATTTKLTLDHTGFPTGLAQHLAEGWRDNYFQPLAQYLAS